MAGEELHPPPPHFLKIIRVTEKKTQGPHSHIFINDEGVRVTFWGLTFWPKVVFWDYERGREFFWIAKKETEGFFGVAKKGPRDFFRYAKKIVIFLG